MTQVTIDLSGEVFKNLGVGVVERLRLVEQTGDTEGMACTRDIIGAIADQIEKQIPKPKPEEPTGWLARVEDAEGREYVRVYERGYLPWRKVENTSANGRHAEDRKNLSYDEINAVKVLSPGV